MPAKPPPERQGYYGRTFDGLEVGHTGSRQGRDPSELPEPATWARMLRSMGLVRQRREAPELHATADRTRLQHEIQSFRGVWWMDDRPQFGGPRYDGELWEFTHLDHWWRQRFRGRVAQMLAGKYDAVELRTHTGQLVRIKRRQALEGEA